ncbi:MAG: UPF0182 family protein [Actinomycetales bacterium]|nr:UPF0182 family protein [Actinomycetales bacterium]
MTFQMPGEGMPTAADPERRRGGVLLPTIVILGVIVLGFVLFTGFYTDWLWFQSVDMTQVFTIGLMTRGVMFLAFGAVMAAGLLLTMWWAWRSRPTFRGMTPEQASLERYRLTVEPYRARIGVIIALVVGGFTGLTASGEWGSYLMWRNATPFGITDPQFGIDLSFYTFTLPFIRFLLGFAFALAFLSLIAAVLIQYLYGGLRLQPPGDRATKAAQVQVSLIIAVILLLKAAAYWLDRYELATKSETLVTGFTGLKYTDVYAVLPSLNILTFVAVIVAVLFILNAIRQAWAIPLIGLGLMFVTSIVVGAIYPLIVQQFQVRPNELLKEQPYIERNITATRDAYGISGATVQDYPGTVDPPSQSVIDSSKGTLDNIRLLDPAVVSPTYNQLQQIRGYYSFNSKLDVDRYVVDGQLRGSVVAVREINLAGIPDGQRNWTNERAVFTHGYGFVSAYDNTALSNGQPDFFESNIPPTGGLDVSEPRVYFGELSPTYSIVGGPKGSQPIELDYPDDASPTGQKTNTYQGTGGVPMGSPFGRLLFATKFQDSNILLSDLVNPDSRILWDRDPLTRVEKVAPWLTLDQDPYPIVADGRIKWMVDGYTTSNAYPYSSRVSLSDATSDSISTRAVPVGLMPQDQLNYARNSVKAVVDAYDGTVTLYAWDESDPVLQTWMKAFPGTVVPKSQMSDEVLAHVRYPQDIFKVQRVIMSRYHVTDATTFYNGTDVWIVPFDPTVAPAQVFQPPYYLSLKMPDQQQAAFSITTTFAPQRRQTLAAFMAVNSTPGDDYGTIRVLQLPSNTAIPGPQQVQNNFESDPVVSSQLSLLRRGGSDVEFGNLLSLPFNGGLLYVEPVYIRASTDGYPLLRKVLVGYGANVALEDTLDVALERVFSTNPDSTPDAVPDEGGDLTVPTPSPSTPQPTSPSTPEPTGPTTPPPSTGDPITDLAAAIADAQAAYDAGQEALKTGDFTAYDRAQKALAEALGRAADAEARLTGGDAASSAPSGTAQPA